MISISYMPYFGKLHLLILEDNEKIRKDSRIISHLDKAFIYNRKITPNIIKKHSSIKVFSYYLKSLCYYIKLMYKQQSERESKNNGE